MTDAVAMSGDATHIAWLDADTVFDANVPEGFLADCVGESFVAFLGRESIYTESGFVVYNIKHDCSLHFFMFYRDMYLTGAFAYLGEWHDCYVFDTVRKLLKVPGVNMAEGLEGEELMHPFLHTAIGKYADHLKGPRKDLGASPERKAI